MSETEGKIHLERIEFFFNCVQPTSIAVRCRSGWRRRVRTSGRPCGKTAPIKRRLITRKETKEKRFDKKTKIKQKRNVEFKYRKDRIVSTRLFSIFFSLSHPNSSASIVWLLPFFFRSLLFIAAMMARLSDRAVCCVVKKKKRSS